MKRMFAIGFLSFFLAFSGLFPLIGSAQTADPDRQAALKAELDQLNKEIESQQIILKAKQRESVSLERDVAILNAEIEEAKLSVRASNIVLQGLAKDIGQKSKTIGTLSDRIEKNKESLGDLIRRTNEVDDYSLTEIVLTNQNFSDFFSDVDSYASIKSSLHDLYLEITDVKEQTEAARNVLNKKSLAEQDALAVIQSKKRQIESKEKEKKNLLATSKKIEKGYETVLKQRQARANEIKAALFGLRDTAAIPFGTALEYANIAYQKTGVRPAFLLAILTQETNLGQNLGTCNRAGDPPEKSWRVIMKPDRDQAPFQAITRALGFDPNIMPLSCPLKGVGGWGGAMGPAQFIPSTWKLFEKKIALALGISTPNPWDPRDAFTASALFLADLGAGKGGYSAEREAALRYYAGGAWNLKKNAFYGNGVMTKAQNIQENMIDPLNI